ncbi:MAG: hypothetical protein WHV44_04810 [Anaerolineales bacterium]
MHADDFVEHLQSLGRKILSTRPGAYPQPITQAARTWAAIHPIEPQPDQTVQDDIADLMARYYISPVVIGDFAFVTPTLRLRRLRFLTFKRPNRKALNLFVDTFESKVYQAPNAWDTQTSIEQSSSDFLDCLGSYAYHLSLCTVQNIAVPSQLRSLESEFLMRIGSIPGSVWWRQTVDR